jgi:hypothetical protein
MIDYLDEIVVAYDKALKELSDGFIAIKKKSNMSYQVMETWIYSWF